jgi:outer membrane protein TolC
VTYPLDLSGGIRRTVEAARADAESVQAVRDDVRVTVAAAITQLRGSLLGESLARGHAIRR